jgi:hypothetical protein
MIKIEQVGSRSGAITISATLIGLGLNKIGRMRDCRYAGDPRMIAKCNTSCAWRRREVRGHATKLNQIADKPVRAKRMRIGRGIGSGKTGKGELRTGASNFEGDRAAASAAERGFRNTSFAVRLNEISLGKAGRDRCGLIDAKVRRCRGHGQGWPAREKGVTLLVTVTSAVNGLASKSAVAEWRRPAAL